MKLTVGSTAQLEIMEQLTKILDGILAPSPKILVANFGKKLKMIISISMAIQIRAA